MSGSPAALTAGPSEITAAIPQVAGDAAPPPDNFGRRPRSRTIHRRIVRTLALPVAAALVLLTVIAVGEVENYRGAAATARAVTLDLAVQDLIQELQTERGLTAGLLGGNGGFKSEMAPERQRVDARRAAVEKLIADGGAVEDRVASAVRQLDGLSAVRAGTDTGAAGRAATFAFYTQRIAELSNVDYGLDSSTDTELRRGASALRALSEVKEATAQERAFLNGVFSASGFKTGEFLQFVTMTSNKNAALAAFDRYATASEKAGRDYVFDTGAARESGYFERVALGSNDGGYLQVNPQSWWSALTTVLDDMLTLERHVGSVMTARAGTLQKQATARMGVLLGAVLICIAGSIYLATIASRSVAGPLASLAGEANRLAGEQLPEAVRRAVAGDEGSPPGPVRVSRGASDEVRLVADAFDRVQATAYALATEQAQLRRSTAESLANLGRRNQNLLRRQLGFITRLEREETNPNGLANLFELDHLATRMRRNAESLLVLVGAASPRQWSRPLPITDVIRAAVSEVEEYRRVTLRRVDEAMIPGAVASGIAHMLAELIENGLAFSPPDVDVEIHGRLINGSYLIAVSDQGVGLSPDDLERANQRLRGEGDFITAPARYLGHYVVGRLAVEMGVEVQLTPSPVTGVTARIGLPAELVSPIDAVASDPASGGAVPRQRRPASPDRASAEIDPRRPDALRLPPGHSPAPVSPAPAGPAPVGLAPTGPAPAGPRIAGGRRLRPSKIEYVVLDGASPPAPGEVMSLHSFEPPPPAVDDEAERTPNGLRKRTPKAPRTGARTAVAAASATAEQPTAVSDTPEAVRSRLTAFRDGVQRGSTETAGQL
ncbi:nitrate- and nitrite sensing domain-containing protein [Actinoplanes sp. KI2]|uniref:sensor histidine kinase n=1 Tax=Actinoplanes sp. KI2 TaxID=2983315 RepID=UPI0021D58F58|nr:nitrate- and nitrite sensing domain-containing protein [Actinoplanes sp. KI2]MCU7727867.1 nitrate- and nitrite sensing domain-containing protein [Actinoplanes sp. KI2]